MKSRSDIEKRFLHEIALYDGTIRSICFMHSSPSSPFDDLYQETMVNLWRGFANFRGESSMNTWIYRVTINTCITWLRHNRRHDETTSIDQAMEMIPDSFDEERRRDLADMYMLISKLDPLEKSIVMMWLDESSYDEIAAVTGLTHGAVATRLNRIKHKLSEAESNLNSSSDHP